MNKDPNIKITVKTSYLDKHSQPEHQRFAFSYTINIENHSDISAQLLSRHWIITDAKDHQQEVAGEGVVGEKPHIAAGAAYTYSSHAVIETTAGTMEGSYTMIAEDGTIFDVPIPAFSLVKPQALH
jgi:ApaG protein